MAFRLDIIFEVSQIPRFCLKKYSAFMVFVKTIMPNYLRVDKKKTLEYGSLLTKSQPT